MDYEGIRYILHYRFQGGALNISNASNKVFRLFLNKVIVLRSTLWSDTFLEYSADTRMSWTLSYSGCIPVIPYAKVAKMSSTAFN
jgi:hypothetical protein